VDAMPRAQARLPRLTPRAVLPSVLCPPPVSDCRPQLTGTAVLGPLCCCSALLVARNKQKLAISSGTEKGLRPMGGNLREKSVREVRRLHFTAELAYSQAGEGEVEHGK